MGSFCTSKMINCPKCGIKLGNADQIRSFVDRHSARYEAVTGIEVLTARETSGGVELHMPRHICVICRTHVYDDWCPECGARVNGNRYKRESWAGTARRIGKALGIPYPDSRAHHRCKGAALSPPTDSSG